MTLTRPQRQARSLVLVLVAAIVLVVLWTAANHDPYGNQPARPHCPTEDSCQPIYHHGTGWTIVEVTP